MEGSTLSEEGSPRKRRRSLSPTPPPNRPLPPLPPRRSLDSHRLSTLHPSAGQSSGLTYHVSKSTPTLEVPTLSESRASTSSRASEVDAVAQKDESKHPSALGSLLRGPVRRVQSFSIAKVVPSLTSNAASKSSVDLSALQPETRPLPRRKSSNFNFLRKKDSRPASPVPPIPAALGTPASSDGGTPASEMAEGARIDLSKEAKPPDTPPRLPEFDATSFNFDPDVYELPAGSPEEGKPLPQPVISDHLEKKPGITFAQQLQSSANLDSALLPIAERSPSDMSPIRKAASMNTRPRSSTGASKTPSLKLFGLRRSNSISSVASSSPPSLPPKSGAAFSASLPSSTVASPVVGGTPPGSRRPSTASSVFGGLKRMVRRRSSAASFTNGLPSSTSASTSVLFLPEPEEDEAEALSSRLDLNASKQLLPVPAVRRRESTSSLSSGNTGRTSGDVATTEATSQLADLPLPRSPLSASRSRSNSLLRSTLPPSPSKQSLKPEQDESPEHYLARLREICSPTEIARVLASSSDALNTAALEAYIASFDFVSLPIDIAVRKLLMELFLPKETQQIDRVMEAFAKRYHEQNPQLFTATDQPYLIAFAMIMLHTDAFNSANKNKMTKAAFIKNTRSEGVSAALLDYIYDNVCFSPFIFVDEADVIGQRGLGGQDSGSSTFLPGLAGKVKVDPYYLITNGLTRKLRAEVDLHIPTKNPFSITGTVPFFNSSSLHRSFADAPTLRVLLPPKPQFATPNGLQEDVLTPREGAASSSGASPTISAEIVTSFKVSKVGLLYRMEFAPSKSKKPSASKWREWSVVLTGSQLLFLRDPIWGLDLSNQILRSRDSGVAQLKSPRDAVFRPDGALSLQDAIAVFDWTFVERANSFTLIVGGTRQYQLQAPDAADMNDWIAAINYAASFKTAGVRMRGHSSQLLSTSASAAFTATVPAGVTASLTASSLASMATTGDGADKADDKTPVMSTKPLPTPSAAEWEDDHVFEQFSSSDLRYRSDGTKTVLTTRSDIIRNKIMSLETSITADKASLQADLRMARNLAVLTPFRSSTRERIQEQVPALARRVRNTRLALCKSVLMREVLARDLLAEEREVQRARQTSPLATTVPLVSATEEDVGLVRKGSNRIRRSLTDAALFTPPIRVDPAVTQSPLLRAETPVIEGSSDFAISPMTPNTASDLDSQPPSRRVSMSDDESAVAWQATKASKRVTLVELPALAEWPRSRLEPTIDEES